MGGGGLDKLVLCVLDLSGGIGQLLYHILQGHPRISMAMVRLTIPEVVIVHSPTLLIANITDLS